MKQRKLSVNAFNSEVMWCPSYVNVGRMHVRLKGKQIVEKCRFKYLRAQVA